MNLKKKKKKEGGNMLRIKFKFKYSTCAKDKILINTYKILVFVIWQGNFFNCDRQEVEKRWQNEVQILRQDHDLK